MQAFASTRPDPFEPCMGCDRVQPIKHEMTDQMHRMRRHNEVNKGCAEIEQMFNRMHAEPGPWADIGIAMMQRMKPIERVGVQKAVYPIEIKAFPNWDQKEDGNKPDGAVRPCEAWRISIGHGPPNQCFVSGPDCDTRRQCPKHVVGQLALKREHTPRSWIRARVIFVIWALQVGTVENAV